jgi:hypothetical protein
VEIMKGLFLFGITAAMLPSGAVAQDGGDAAARVAKLDEKLLKGLTELATLYDGRKDPEAAHFFCECALGWFGARADEKLKAMHKKWEDEVYYGRSRGGAVLADAKPIDEKLSGLAKDYKTVFDELVKVAAEKKGLADEAKRILHDVAAKYELSKSAGEYVQATQRFNEVRLKMKVRAILWDFEGSRKLILAGWYMSETGDWAVGGAPKTQDGHVAFGDHVEWAKERSSRTPFYSYSTVDFKFSEIADELRAFALTRADLLNPDVRRLLLGRGGPGKELNEIRLYAIPRDHYRKEIATPSARARETVAEARDNWVDVEDSVALKAGGRVLLARYPFEGELDAPVGFGHGRNEYGWQDKTVESKGLSSYGLPIMLRFFGGKELSDVACEVKKKGGYALSTRDYVTGDKRVELGDLPTVLLLPEKPLDKGTDYVVKIKGKLDGTPFEKKWEFKTREK